VRVLQLPRIIIENNIRLQNPFAKEYMQAVRESVRRRFEIAVAFLTTHVNDRIKDGTAPKTPEPVVAKLDDPAGASAQHPLHRTPNSVQSAVARSSR
jgi:hypothetical protein